MSKTGAERTVFPDGLARLRLGHLRARLPEGYAITGQILLEDVAERTDVRHRLRRGALSYEGRVALPASCCPWTDGGG